MCYGIGVRDITRDMKIRNYTSDNILKGRKLNELEVKVMDKLNIDNSPLINQIIPNFIFGLYVPNEKFNHYIAFNSFFVEPSVVEIFHKSFRDEKKIVIYSNPKNLFSLNS